MTGKTWLATAVILALAMVVSFVVSTLVASRAYLQRGVQPYRENRTLSVTGSARRRIESDLAIWKVRVVGEGKDLQGAYRQLEDSESRLRGFLDRWKFGAGTVVAEPINTEVHHKRDDKGNLTREVVSFELSRRYRITESDVAKVAKAAGEVTTLLKDGSRIEGSTPEFVYTRIQELKVEMMGQATADARARAEQIARNSGCRLAEVRDARAGVLQITAPWSTEVSSSGIHDTSTVAKDVTSVVSLTIGIEPSR